MLKIAFKSVMARKGRLFMSALGVIASCAFLSGVFVFSDTVTNSFDRLFANAFANVDSVVRSSNVIEGDFGNDTRDRVSVDLVDAVLAVPGVVEAEGDVQSSASMSVDGEEIGISGPPKFGGTFTGSEASPWRIVDGRVAAGGGEVVIDKRSSDTADVAVGDTITVTTTVGSREFEVVGIATFAGNDTSGGATWALFDIPTASEFVIGAPGLVDAVMVRGDGSVSEEELQARIADAVGSDSIEVLTGQEIIEENQSAVQDGLSFFTTVLTIFAAIATFVGCFIIYNVFKISTAQRLRENALMRAIGASRGQVVRAQLVEAVIVGILGGLLGFIGGIALAFLILAILTAVGFAPSDAPLAVEPSAFVLTMIVGVFVTLVCAVAPAIRAGRTPPLAAMRDVSIDRSSHSRRRLILGIVAAVIAVVGVAIGLSGSTIWLAPGVMGLFISVIAFGPLVVGPLAEALVRPLRALRGVTGEIAARNAARSPERTALTAAALGICLTLLVAVATLGSSITQSFRDTIAEQFNGDISITTENQDGLSGLPVGMLPQVLELPEVATAVSFGGAAMRIERNGELKDTFMGVVNAEGAADLLTVPFIVGGWDEVSGTDVGVSKDRAESDDLEYGDTIEAQYLDGTPVTLTVRAIYDSDFLGAVGADRSLFEDVAATGGGLRFDFQILAAGAEGVSADELKAAVTTVTDEYPVAKTETRDEFIDSQVAQLGGILNFIYALLGMSVFIAVLGIVLTLLLSVYERRRELGLVRAVGMTKGQVRASVRWESIVTALLGAAMGVGLGVALAWIVVKALEDEGLTTFAISPISVIVFTLMAVIFAVIAAWVPARKAANADILEAIATT